MGKQRVPPDGGVSPVDDFLHLLFLSLELGAPLHPSQSSDSVPPHFPWLRQEIRRQLL